MNDFQDIVADDDDIRRQTEDWAYGEVGGGRSPEDVAADLAASGWSADDADAIAETARQKTRHLRGVTTGADVARQAGRRYQSAMRDVPLVGYKGSFGALGGFVRSVLRFISAGRTRHRTPRGRDLGGFKPDE